jgi:hypothetical protein
MDIPVSMQAELQSWNNESGIDLTSWVGCEGRFGLAVGYCSIFWPDFVLFNGYILRKGFSESALQEFERREGTDRKSVECVMNHLHIADIQYYNCPDISKDKLLFLGARLQEIYEAKLQWQFPDRPYEITLYIPPEEDDLLEYQIYFWQKTRILGQPTELIST